MNMNKYKFMPHGEPSPFETLHYSRMRNKILEEIQDVLTTTINHLKKEIEAIKKNEIFWSKRRGVGEFGPGYGGEETIKRLVNASSAIFKDVIHKDTDLESKFIFHDKLREELNERYAEVGKKVRTQKFEERFENILILNQLKELDSDLLDKIKEKREEYRKEYHFTKYEIDPKLKEREEW